MPATFQFSNPLYFWIGAGTLLLAALFATIRRLPLPWQTLVLILVGMLSLSLAAGGLSVTGNQSPRIAVMVDLSPSTRGASWCDPRWLGQRVTELCGNASYRVYQFSSAENVKPIAIARPLTELAADETAYAPPLDADVVLLFSDARFTTLPAHIAPTFIVVDPQLESPSDGAVLRLASRDEDDVVLVVRNQLAQDASERPRRLAVSGVRPSGALPAGEPLGEGTFTFHASRDDSGAPIVARMVGNDRWPENDELQLSSSSAKTQRWWITSSSDQTPPPDASWIAMPTDTVPTDAGAYLAPSIIVLNDVSAESLSLQKQQRLLQYVHDLGGALVILGGEHAYAAGSYSGTTLDTLSPLASTPPEPKHHWVLLVDSSGSMAATAAGSARTRWQVAVDSLVRAISSLPPNDPISIGDFAQSLRWWSFGKPLADTLKLELPPHDATPRGPTNLQPALEQLAGGSIGSTPVEVLLLSDADATIDHPADLAQRLRDAKVRVHLLATGAEPSQGNPVVEVVAATGGKFATESDPAHWATRLRELLRAVLPDALMRSEVTVQFHSTLQLPSRRIRQFNSTWAKANVTELATTTDQSRATILAAEHRVGLGRVVALAFAAEARELDAIASRFAIPPRDPRFGVTWHAGSTLRITVDAVDERGKYLDGLDLQLLIDSKSLRIEQTAPGRYELSLPSPRHASIATIRLGDNLVDRAAIAGHFPPEFDAVGNDRLAMRRLAETSGGRVVEPSETTLDLPRRHRMVVLSSELAFAGCALIGLGLVHWRRST